MLRKIILTIVFCFSIVVILLCKVNPQIFRIIRFQQPGVKTYEHFPVRKMEKSSNPFVFPEKTQLQDNLDTLHVENGKGEMVPFSHYFESGGLLAFLVVRNDTLIYEKYGSNYQRSTVSNTFSIGKSMISLLTGKAIELGFIDSPKQYITDFIPQFRSNTDVQNLSVANLLNMKSGLKFKRAGGGLISDLFCDEARFFYTSTLKKDLLHVTSDTLSGQRWKYSNLDPLILTWAIESATGMYVSDFFQQEIWEPIGAEYNASWGVDQVDGLENSPSSFQCTAIDLAKVGRLLIKNGRRDSTQILSSDWIAQSISIHPENRTNTSKGMQKATHQYYWWLPQENFEGDFSAEGLRGQRLYVNPSQNIIIVQFANRGYGGYPYRAISDYLSAKVNTMSHTEEQ